MRRPIESDSLTVILSKATDLTRRHKCGRSVEMLAGGKSKVRGLMELDDNAGNTKVGVPMY